MTLASRVDGLAREEWDSVFASEESLNRAIEHLFACSATMGRRTISRTIAALGRDQVDWSADYRLYSRSPWEGEALFGPIVRYGLPLTGSGPIALAMDDTKLSKTGRLIPHAGWHRDPMSPPFHVNLRWGLRYLQVSLLVHDHSPAQTGCRSLPIRFEPAPWVKKPGKKATDAQRAAYQQQKKEQNLSRTGRAVLLDARKQFDAAGAHDRPVIVAADGSFCNKAFFAEPLDRVFLLARARRDARLCYPAPSESRRTYQRERFTPEQVRQDDSIPWAAVTVFYAGKTRAIRYKERANVLWQRGSGSRPVRLIVIAPQPYSAPNGRSYRDPAYLLTDDLESPASLLIQIYFDRWQIEVNHREEKQLMGVGQAQVWSDLAAQRHPTFQVACYSLILLAGLLEFGPSRNHAYAPLPKWRKHPARPSFLDLLTRIRFDLCDETPNSPLIPQISLNSLVLSAFT
jgi:hypothetical protein